MCLRLSDPERATLAEIRKRLGRKVLARVTCVAKERTAALAAETRWVVLAEIGLGKVNFGHPLRLGSRWAGPQGPANLVSYSPLRA